jgi:2-oxo-4-hydroxy-4-carboxy-5-ureidoimidazoline decarboxylase
MRLDRFNTLGAAEAAATLRAVNGSSAWVAAMLAGRPFPSVDLLLAASDAASRQLGPDDVDEALADHPRIGERHSGDGESARLSQREQSAVSRAGEDVLAALASGNRAYEERFGRVFLIRAAGRDAGDILGELRRRLANDPASEDVEVARQLAEITRLRLEEAIVS